MPPVLSRTRNPCGAYEGTIQDWPAGARFDHGLGRLRLDLYDDEGRLNAAAAETLARHYLAFGFGAEAAFWLQQIPGDQAPLLRLADILDGREPEWAPEAIDSELCSDEAVLWAYMAAPQALTLGQDIARRVQRATVALPPVLRDQIAPRVARQLFQDGFPNAARNLRDMLARAQTVPDSVLLSLDLDLGLTPDVPGSTPRDALAMALRDDGADPATIMAQALAFDRTTGHRISETRLTAADALLREHGFNSGTARLWQEVVLAHAARSDLQQVLAYLEKDGIAASHRDQTLSLLFQDRLEAADTASLYILARLYGATWHSEGSAAGRARVGAIAHLREADLMDAVEDLRAGQRTLILPARPTPPETAQSTLRTAWQASDWAALAQADAAPHRAIAERMQTYLSGPALAPAATELPGIAAAVAESQALRADIARLLATPTPRAAGPDE
jgi:hypothetical protein